MPNTTVRSSMIPGRFHSYLIGGNACNTFALGDVGSADDFFLVGAEPRDESIHPVLTGNFLDAEGKVLFRLVRNVLEVNTRECSKVVTGHSGYEIRDAAGTAILKVSTESQRLADGAPETFVTTIAGKFYDIGGRTEFEAKAGSADEKAGPGLKAVFGLSGFGAFGLVNKMSETETDIAKAVLQSGGANHRVLTGPISGQTIELDRTVLWDVQLSKCTINVRSSNVSFVGSKTAFHNCEINFFEGAVVLKNLISHVLREGK
ncbi:hypothetical protein DFR24_1142 [Panacagrimonas perspica]|uniref:Uncharacterized protein n=1 Tax=Panacagrimonas perspica TaxID=381431 RepID=A0A4R7PDZ4_9GAMM|nr:hypothetical protein [Panacagrimonas perspica]TDU31761.1 hypothetical protein DFR24_1142 [Panacagrimonas perspica]